MCEKKTKVCSKCKIEKPLTEYCKDKKVKDGFSIYCKKCKSEYDKKWRENNREKWKKSVLKYKEKNRETIAEKSRLYRKENLDKTRVSQRNWREKNPNYGKLSRQRRKARLKEATIENFSYEELLDFWIENEINYKECFYCEKEMLEGPEHIDHYYPLAKGGTHERANLRPSCASCNSRKHAKDPEVFMEELKNGV